MTETDAALWPSVRDVAREMDVTVGYIFQLVHAKPPRLRAVRTRIGWLLDPTSVATFKAQRMARQQQRQKRTA
jgi:hypothetical protein